MSNSAAADSSYYTLIHPNSKLIRTTFQNDKSENIPLFLHSNLSVSRFFVQTHCLYNVVLLYIYQRFYQTEPITI